MIAPIRRRLAYARQETASVARQVFTVGTVNLVGVLGGISAFAKRPRSLD